MKTLLVANRGEIALRIFRTARAMGFRCVAVYSDADEDAPFVKFAHEAIRLGPPAPAESYLNIDAILRAATNTNADLVHPGYGFLAENPDFAGACESSGVTFVGPPSAVLEAMGDKVQAKLVATKAGVPVLDGYSGDDQSDEGFLESANRIGYPVIAKAAAGGGGKGMTVIQTRDELPAALASARRLARAAFGDDRMMLERYLRNPRHVEVQIIADEKQVIHLGERDCSAQRRHQKVLEESPCVAIDQATSNKLCESAVALATTAGYRNAGTCEFLVGDDTFGFIELNARLQVEHAVTEAVTGLDLVELQLKVALGHPLGLSQDDIRFNGHAVEARVYAEDPSEDFLPSTGKIVHLSWPPNARIDTGVKRGSIVTTHYDPMLAKLIVHAASREAALAQMDEALFRTELLGVRTNLSFLAALVSHPDVQSGQIHTNWIESALAQWTPTKTRQSEAIATAAAAEAGRLAPPSGIDIWGRAGPWRLSGPVPIQVVLRPDGVEQVVEVTDHSLRAPAVFHEGVWYVWLDDQYEIPAGLSDRETAATSGGHLAAPMPGQVVSIAVEAGQAVSEGQELVVVEAMKMEHAVKAPSDGVITALRCGVSDQVSRGQTLVDFEPVEAPSQ